jgi:pyruvate dehydrogenase E1 component alpha subunit
VVATYREHGQALARGVGMDSIMAEMYGKVEGCSRGRGGSMHLFDAATRFYGGNAIVGGGLPLAVGLALADKLKPREGCVTACFFGEGAVAEGAFHESLNLAALWKLPVLFICENNLYAMGTALARSEAQIDLTKKAASYGLPTAHINGMNVLAVHEAAKDAVARVRETQAPFFLELHTYRFRAHSMFDAELYRDKAEVERWKQHGPIHTFTDRLKAAGMMSEDDFLAIDREAMAEVDAAVRFAEAGSWEPAGELTRDVCTPVATPSPPAPLPRGERGEGR